MVDGILDSKVNNKSNDPPQTATAPDQGGKNLFTE